MQSGANGRAIGALPSIDTIHITPQLLSLVADIVEFKSAWCAPGVLAPDRLPALRRVATIESIGSSTRIEGSRFNDRDVERLLASIHIGRFVSRDAQELAGCADVMEHGFGRFQGIASSENLNRQLHQHLWINSALLIHSARLVHSAKAGRHRGPYTTAPNSVAAFDENGGQIAMVFETASPFATPQRMPALAAWFSGERASSTLLPLIAIAV